MFFRSPAFVNRSVSLLSSLCPIVIDGSSVAMSHAEAEGLMTAGGRQPLFSSRAIDLCVDFFRRRGHTDAVANIQQSRLEKGRGVEPGDPAQVRRSGCNWYWY